MPLPWDHLEVRVNSSFRVQCEPGWTLAESWSRRLNDFDVWLVWSGRGTMRLRDRTIDLRPGVCIWARPSGLYLGEQDPDDRLCVSAVHFDLIDRRRGQRIGDRRLPGEVHDLIDPSYADGLLRRVGELLQRSGMDRSKRLYESASALLRGLLMDIEASSLAGRAGVLNPTEAHHRQVIASIAAQLATTPHMQPSVDDLAERAGYSPDHFARVFRQVMGQTPRAFMIHARITRARQLLSETNLSIGRIARVLGYGDVYYFSRQFHQRTGCSPTEYRRGVGVT